MEKVITARAPSDHEIDWVKFGRTLRQGSPKVVDDEAKALVALASTLLTVYTGAITLFKIPENFDSLFKYVSFLGIHEGLFRALIFMVPIALWLISIGLNLFVYFPKYYEADIASPNRTKQLLEAVIDTKYSRLKWGGLVFLAALAWSTLIIGLMSITPPEVPSQTELQFVQFVVPGNNFSTLENMDIYRDTKSQWTKPVNLIEKTNNSIKVELSDGRKVEFKRDLVDGIIYLNEERQINASGD
ncbi:MAG: hypothetical protein EHM14_15295 [Methanothrix sp.]|nr:MAG: hypothetical protein EHM14_15295 [Methanothrix sp.]